MLHRLIILFLSPMDSVLTQLGHDLQVLVAVDTWPLMRRRAIFGNPRDLDFSSCVKFSDWSDNNHRSKEALSETNVPAS